MIAGLHDPVEGVTKYCYSVLKDKVYSYCLVIHASQQRKAHLSDFSYPNYLLQRLNMCTNTRLCPVLTTINKISRLPDWHLLTETGLQHNTGINETLFKRPATFFPVKVVRASTVFYRSILSSLTFSIDIPLSHLSLQSDKNILHHRTYASMLRNQYTMYISFLFAFHSGRQRR